MSYRPLSSDAGDEVEAFHESQSHVSHSEAATDLFEPTTEESDAPYHETEEEDEDEESDPDYEDLEEDVDEEAEDDEDDEFHDADDGEGGLEFVIETVDETVDEAGDDAGETAREAATGNAVQRTLLRLMSGNGSRPAFITQRQLLALLRGQDLGHALFDGDDDEDDNLHTRRRRRPPPDPNRFPKVPSEKGRELMDSGVFGTTDRRMPLAERKQLARRVLDRELGIGGGGAGDRPSRKRTQAMLAQEMIPSSKPEMIIQYDDPVCCGQFSDDGNFFYACVKDFRVRMYDTSNPYAWRHYKTVYYPFGEWTLTDADLSPDNRWLVYTSLQSSVCMAPTDPNDMGDPYALDLGATGDGGAGAGRTWRSRRSFSIFGIKFSGDGRHLVAGTGDDSIVVYDIESRTVLHNVAGHDHDVNAVCFADRLSPHILYSGSDDCTIKVWDTRSMGDGREAGAFVGHIEGLTYIDSKGDGRYILSNGKDQSMKLWDLRMAMTTARFAELNAAAPTRNRGYDYDYRWEEYEDQEWFQHPHDNSLVTYRGHKVQRTLIRCHFSPPGSTDSRYVYSGSQDGFVYVWNLDGTPAAKIDVKSSVRGMRSSNARYRSNLYLGANGDWATLVRDVGWHPNAPMLVASSWNGPQHGSGTATVHSWNEAGSDEGEPRMGISVDDKLRGHPSFVIPEAQDEDDEDDDDDGGPRRVWGAGVTWIGRA